MKADVFYSVSELSKIAGVSVRTLHHYDDIGLLKAERNPVNGYRRYSIHNAVFLQQVIMYRDMDMSLDSIKNIMMATNFDLMEAMKKQHLLLLQRQSETQLKIDKLEVTMSTLRGEQNIDIMFEGLPSDKTQEWKSTITDVNNGGDAILRAYSHLSESEMAEETRLSKEWCKRYINVIEQPVHAKIVQNLVKEAYIMANRIFSNTLIEAPHFVFNYEAYLKTAELNKTNQIVREMYEHYKEGLADHLYDAMLFFAENSLKDNETDWVNRI